MKGTGIIQLNSEEHLYLFTTEHIGDMLSHPTCYFQDQIGNQLSARDWVKKKRIVLPLELAL